MVRNRGLRQMNAFFDIAGAEPDFFSDGAGAPNLQYLQDPAPGRVGDGVQETRKGLVLTGHELRDRRKIDGCQCGKNRLKISYFRLKISDLDCER